MSMFIKIQVWRGNTLIDENVCPVQPGVAFIRSFGPLGFEPIIDRSVALRGFKLEQDAVFLDETPNAAVEPPA